MDYTHTFAFGEQQHHTGNFDLPSLQPVPRPLSPRGQDPFHHERPDWRPQTLPSIPEEADRGDTHSSVDTTRSPASNCEGPPAKKQCISCTGCNDTFGANKSLLRHQRGCKAFSAKHHQPLSSYRCKHCGLRVARSDTLRRHVARQHGESPQESRGTVLQSPSDTVLASHGNEFDLKAVQSTTPRPLSDPSSATPRQVPNNLYTTAVPYSHDAVASGSATGERQMELDTQMWTNPTLENMEHAAIPFGVSTPYRISISSEEPSIHTSSNEVTPVTCESSPATSVQSVPTKVDPGAGDDIDVAELAAQADRLLNLLDVPYPSVKPVSQGRNLRPRRIRSTIPCPLCGYELGYGPEDNGIVKTHLERHLKRMDAITFGTLRLSDSEATCTDCQIHFLDKRDLVKHKRSVQRGQGCGFNFDHRGEECAGHHPHTVEGQFNPDHRQFEKALRHWESFLRRAFEEYVEAYSQGMVPTNAPSFEPGQPACRRSAGSILSVMSSKSAISTRSVPTRFLYFREAHENNLRYQDPPRILSRSIADAFKNEQFNVVMKMCFESRLFSCHNIWEDDLYLSIRLDATWFHAGSKPERLVCFTYMVEQGLNVSKLGVTSVAHCLEKAIAGKLLNEDECPIHAPSRLAQYVFLYAILRGLDRVVSMLLDHGILNTESPMPDANFVRYLIEQSTVWCGDEPSPDATIDTGGIGFGSWALTLTLNACQYRAASLLVEHGVAPFWGISLLATNKSAMHHLRDEFHRSRQQSAVLPAYLDLLVQKLLEGPGPTGLDTSFGTGLLLT